MNQIKQLKLKTSLDKNEFVNTLSKIGIDINEDLLTDDYIAEPLKNYLYLTYLPQFVESPKDELTCYYGRYFWLSTVAERFKDKFGHDNGFEQQAFKILEEAETLDTEVNWSVMEQLQNEAKVTVN